MTEATALARKVEEKCSADQRWAELLREIAAGNQEALAELYDQNKPDGLRSGAARAQ